MKILGIDPGTATTGFGVIDIVAGKSRFLDGGVISTLPGLPMTERLAAIHSELSSLIAQHRPDTMAVELLYFATNVTTAMTVGQARGVVLLAAGQAGIPVEEYTPMQIKLGVTGYGKATKGQVQEMVRVLLGLVTIPKPDDAADALAVALTHGHQAAVEASGV